jgi:RNA polymerase sigma-70 factor (ECF subfamily)
MCRIVTTLLPDRGEPLGLLALMLLQHSRRDARTDDAGGLVLLDDQDRARWDHGMIDDGLATLDRALALHEPGPYQVQAAIAALHARAPRPEDTDWPQIASLYAGLGAMTPSPVIELNRAVAVAMADGPGAGLPLLDRLGDDLDGYHLFHSARTCCAASVVRPGRGGPPTRPRAKTNAAERRSSSRRARRRSGIHGPGPAS